MSDHLALTSKKIAEMIDIPYRTLMNWFSYGLFNMKRSKAGRGFSVIWTQKDLNEARQIASFVKQGLSIQAIRKVANYLRSQGFNPFSGKQYLVLKNGEPCDIIKEDNENLFSTLAKQGQLIIPLIYEETNNE